MRRASNGGNTLALAAGYFIHYTADPMKIYCVRHGEAEPTETNSERSLTAKGRREVECLVNYLASRDMNISHVLHSSKLRAKQTAEIFSKGLAPDDITECECILDEDANVGQLMDMIPSWTDDTLIVGHLPFMPKLISGLVIGDPDNYPIVNYPPSTIVCLEHFHEKRWIINWILHPELVGA